MRVDVHTHVWPDKIAEAVLRSMVNDMGFPVIAGNTVDDIKAHMRGSGVDKSIVLGVVQRADQVTGANDWLINIQDELLVPFGALHPVIWKTKRGRSGACARAASKASSSIR